MMILYRRGYGLFDQEKLAKYFDVRVGKENLNAFNVRLKTFTRLNYDEGLITIESENSINQFFREKKLPLAAKAVKISEIPNVIEFLMHHIRDNNDIWVEYKKHRIFGENGIHGGLVEGLIQLESATKAIVINPHVNDKPRIQIKSEVLEEALSPKFGRETGFVIITGK